MTPKGGLHAPRLQGYRLAPGRYTPIPARQRSRELLAIRSTVLGLEFRFDGEDLRVWNPATGEYLRRIEEERAARRQAESPPRGTGSHAAGIQEQPVAACRSESRWAAPLLACSLGSGRTRLEPSVTLSRSVVNVSWPATIRPT